MDDALRLIIAKSPAAMTGAMDTLRAIGAKSPIAQQRYQHTVGTALADPQAHFTPEERAILASYLEVVESVGNRDKIVQIRVTATEREELDRLTHGAGFSNLSAWTRNLWGLE